MSIIKAGFAALGLTLLSVSVGGAQTSPTATTPAPIPQYGRSITLTEARAVVAAAEAESAANGWPMAITIVNPQGFVVMSVTMDNTQYGSIDVALNKAKTSALFRRPTSAFQNAVKDGFLGVMTVNPITPIEGGEVIIMDGKVIGAIGVSGGSPAQDGQVARKAVTIIGAKTQF